MKRLDVLTLAAVLPSIILVGCLEPTAPTDVITATIQESPPVPQALVAATITDLGTLGFLSVAFGANDLGQVVGQSVTQPPPAFAFVGGGLIFVLIVSM